MCIGVEERRVSKECQHRSDTVHVTRTVPAVIERVQYRSVEKQELNYEK